MDGSRTKGQICQFKRIWFFRGIDAARMISIETIETIKADLEYVIALNGKNWAAVRNSSRPDIDRVFAISSAKLRAVLEVELREATK